MKKRLLLLFCLLLAILPFVVSCSLINKDEKLSAEEIYELVSPSVVAITAESPTVTSSGTGFFYDNGSTIVTNYHVIKDCTEAHITLPNGNEYDVLRVLGYDKTKDIAILEVDYDKGAPLKIRTTEIKTGETVYAIGNSLGFLEGTLSEGIVSTAQRELDGQTYIQITAAVTNGNSGGPLIDSYGNVIGIVSAGFGDGLDLNLAIPISVVGTVSTQNPCTLDSIINVEWISNRQVWHQDENDRYVLVFTLSDANENPIAISGSAIINITNDYNEVVYSAVREFEKSDFQTWYYNNYTVEKYQATIYINDSDITPNYCSGGTLTFSIIGSGYYFDESSLDIEGLPQKSIYNDTVTEKTVYTAQEFVDSINHNRKIILGSQYYDFSNVDISKNLLLQSQTYGRKGFIFNGVYNLSIVGEAEMVIGDLSSVVLSFNNCSKLSLEGVTVGHINPPAAYSCEGAVIYLNGCDDVKITRCKLFGCGSIGIDANTTTGLVVTSTEIFDCNYSGATLTETTATFNGCKFYDLPSADNVISSNHSTLKFTNCLFTDTNVTVSSWDKCFIDSSDYKGNSLITFEGCTFSNNKFENIALSTATNITFKNCTFNNNSTIKAQNGVTYTNCTFDTPPVESSARKTVIEWLSNNYETYQNNTMTYDAYSNDVYYVLEYNTADKDLYIGSYWIFDDGAEMYVLLSLGNNSAAYNYSITYGYDSYKNNTQGTINASAFTENTSLTYTSYTGNYWNQTSLMNMYRSAILNLIEFLDWCLESNQICVTIHDFGFTQIEFID